MSTFNNFVNTPTQSINSINLLKNAISNYNTDRSDCNEGQIRLVNGTIEREGRLEICANGLWGSFCPQSFRKSAAHVACKQAGYGDVKGEWVH